MFMINLQLYLYKLSMINYKSDINDNNFEKWILNFGFFTKVTCAFLLQYKNINSKHF